MIPLWAWICLWIGWVLGFVIGGGLVALVLRKDDPRDEIPADFRQLFAELALYREIMAVATCGGEAIAQGAREAAEKRLAAVLERVLFELELSPFKLPYPGILRQALESLAAEERAVAAVVAEPYLCPLCGEEIIGRGQVVDQMLVCSRCVSNEDGTWAPVRGSWLVIISREGQSEITVFPDRQAAESFFERASVQWSDSYLAEVAIGPDGYRRGERG